MQNAKGSIDYWMNWTPNIANALEVAVPEVPKVSELRPFDTSATFGTCHLGPHTGWRTNGQDPELWLQDFEQWATANCTFSDRCFSSVSSLYIDFCEWSLRDNRIASMRGTFEVLLVMNGFEVVDGLVAGLIPARRARKPRQRVRGSEAKGKPAMSAAQHPTHPIERPAHYTQGSIEVLDFIEDQQLGFCAGNVVKYVCRYRFKGTPLEDLRKARVYLNRLIASHEAEAAAR